MTSKQVLLTTSISELADKKITDVTNWNKFSNFKKHINEKSFESTIRLYHTEVPVTIDKYFALIGAHQNGAEVEHPAGFYAK